MNGDGQRWKEHKIMRRLIIGLVLLLVSSAPLLAQQQHWVAEKGGIPHQVRGPMPWRGGPGPHGYGPQWHGGGWAGPQWDGQFYYGPNGEQWNGYGEPPPWWGYGPPPPPQCGVRIFFFSIGGPCP